MELVAAKTSILVLDDDPSLRRMLKELLEQDGYEVIVAGDVQSALAQCRVEIPGLMIVDLMLPVEDGEMFIREFRRHWRQRQVPVILLSASSARNEIGQRLGVEATLAKPFFAEDLRDLVERVTSRGPSIAAG